jgi:hypothetical protein
MVTSLQLPAEVVPRDKIIGIKRTNDSLQKSSDYIKTIFMPFTLSKSTICAQSEKETGFKVVTKWGRKRLYHIHVHSPRY